VRAAAARSLAVPARGTGPDALDRQHKVVPLLQKALGDAALEVVVEAAEDLGSLGAQEAGPVLTRFLRHPSEPVRQAAAQALERVADPAVLDGLLAALDDPGVTVRFSLVGALGRAASGTLGDDQRKRLLARLETLFIQDADPGVRSRAATVLGECAVPGILPVLWKGVLSGEDARVQEKAWAAFVEILARAASVPLLQEWDRKLATDRQQPRRLQMLTELAASWQKRADLKAQANAAHEALVQAQLDTGKWAAAFPLVRELLTRPGSEPEMNQRLQWLLAVGEQALAEGNRAEALRTVQEARPYLSKSSPLATEFDKLEKRAGDR
jgi:HEAT repeat protein